jgi:hypothetical protein
VAMFGLRRTIEVVPIFATLHTSLLIIRSPTLWVLFSPCFAR